MSKKIRIQERIPNFVKRLHLVEWCWMLSLSHLFQSARSPQDSSGSTDPRWPGPSPWLHTCDLEAKIASLVSYWCLSHPQSAERKKKDWLTKYLTPGQRNIWNWATVIVFGNYNRRSVTISVSVLVKLKWMLRLQNLFKESFQNLLRDFNNISNYNLLVVTRGVCELCLMLTVQLSCLSVL